MLMFINAQYGFEPSTPFYNSVLKNSARFRSKNLFTVS
jgi:hypothetical protein